MHHTLGRFCNTSPFYSLERASPSSLTINKNNYFNVSFKKLGPVYIALEEFQNCVFTLKTHQVFSLHTTPEKFLKRNNNWSV